MELIKILSEFSHNLLVQQFPNLPKRLNSKNNLMSENLKNIINFFNIWFKSQNPTYINACRDLKIYKNLNTPLLATIYIQLRRRDIMHLISFVCRKVDLSICASTILLRF